MKKLTLIGIWALAGCAAQQQRAVNDAYASGQLAKSEAVKACSVSADVTGCMLGVAVAFGGSGADTVPVVQSDLSAVLNSSLLGTVAGVVGQVKQSNNARDVAIAQTGASVAIAQSGDARQVATMRDATASNTAIAGDGFSGIRWVAGDGLSAVSGVAQTSAQAMADIAAAQSAAFAALPPTIQAGGNVTQAGGNVDQSTTGRDRDVTRNTDCTALGGSGAPATAGNNSGTGGASSPLTAAYNPLITGGDGAAGSNNCGGG